jgi:hypothetical protein
MQADLIAFQRRRHVGFVIARPLRKRYIAPSGNADSRSDGVPSKFCDFHFARILMDTVISSNSISQLLRHSDSKWVTRARPKIDRIARPWLIRRQIYDADLFKMQP